MVVHMGRFMIYRKLRKFRTWQVLTVSYLRIPRSRLRQGFV